MTDNYREYECNISAPKIRARQLTWTTDGSMYRYSGFAADVSTLNITQTLNQGILSCHLLGGGYMQYYITFTGTTYKLVQINSVILNPSQAVTASGTTLTINAGQTTSIAWEYNGF